MYCHDPAGQVAIRDLTKACVEEHLFQSFLVREFPNGGREIFVDAGRVMRHFRSNPGKNPERVPIVQCPQPTKDGSGKLQAHKPPTWLQNPVVTAWKVLSGNPRCSALASRQVIRRPRPRPVTFFSPSTSMAWFRSDAMTRPLAPMRGSIKSARSAVPAPTSSASPSVVIGTYEAVISFHRWWSPKLRSVLLR